MLRKETIAPDCLTLLHRLMSMPELASFRLAGGTALALQLGHRISVDLDIFTDRTFDVKELEAILRVHFPSFMKEYSNSLGISGFINGVKTDFYNWAVAFIRPVVETEGVRLAHTEEIAAMKLEAITYRQVKKDYYDVFVLLQRYSMHELFGFYRERYPLNNPKTPLEFLLAAHLADASAGPVLLADFRKATTETQAARPLPARYYWLISRNGKM